MSNIRIVIIDDEHLARDLVKSYLRKENDVEIVGESSDGFEGFKLINELKPDLIFLDVMMPKLTGFEMLELLEERPVVIFSTAYDEFAIQAFEQNAVDYLLKPYSIHRFREALGKARGKITSKESEDEQIDNLIEHHQKKSELLTRVAVKMGSKIHIISTEEIKYIEAMDDYVKLYTEEGYFVKQNTMKYYEAHLAESDFLRIHRSFIVRIKEISRVELMGKDTHVVWLHDGTKLTVSRSGYTRLKEVLDF